MATASDEIKQPSKLPRIVVMFGLPAYTFLSRLSSIPLDLADQWSGVVGDHRESRRPASKANGTRSSLVLNTFVPRSI